MASRLFVSLQERLKNLKASLIVERADYSLYERADHDKALGFLVLASAHVEDYAEQRCLQAMSKVVSDHKKQIPLRSARSLLSWHNVKSETEAIPVFPGEFMAHPKVDAALRRYENFVKVRHGISSRNLRLMVMPIGFRDSDLDQQLFDHLDSVADRRGSAAHVAVNRAKQMTEPVEEWRVFEALLVLLEKFDDSIESVSAERC